MAATVHSIRCLLAQAYLIETEQGLFLVDSGESGAERQIFKAMDRLGRNDLRLIFLTHAHFDHAGSAAAVKQKTGAPILIHPADADDLAHARTVVGLARGRGRLVKPFLGMSLRIFHPQPIQADVLVDDQARLDAYGLEAIVTHTPGHTAGSSCLLVEGRLVFAGDLLSNTGGPHLQRYYAQDWSLLTSSFKRALDLQPEWVYPGHGQPMPGRDLQSLADSLYC
jgi:glyoxylase-like metal-dependent hydrolase (beta-lactamase superfamily II)